MRILTAIGYLTLTAFLSSCDQKHSTPDIDPSLGLQCFESLRASLPPGTQYEGIEKITEHRLTIKIMNGVEVAMTDCALDSDGALKSIGK